jgi:hypothetical protein
MCLAWLLSAAEGSQLDRRAHPLPELLGAVGVVLAWQRADRHEVAAAAGVQEPLDAGRGAHRHVAVYRR